MSPMCLPRRIRLILASAVATLILLLLPGAGLADGSTVTIGGFAYGPDPISIHVGDVVTWTNEDADPHTATAVDKTFDTGTLGRGQSASVTFATAGTFKYTCVFHPEMSGTVVVAAAATLPATDAATVSPTSSSGAAPLTLLLVAALVGTGSWVRRARRSGPEADGAASGDVTSGCR